MSKLDLSVCLIVKNEEKNLRKCLESVLNLADEIIVVDTGSTDNTIQIAKEYTAKIFFFSWIDNFSAARNFAIEQAQKNWILMIDGDEEINTADRFYWERLLTDPKKEGYFVQIQNHGDITNNSIRNPSFRLFRRKAEYRYYGRIHEQILPQICKTHDLSCIGITELVLLHYGYSPELVLQKSKIERNIKLLQLELKNSPQDSFMRFNLGVEYFRMSEYQLAAWNFRAAMNLSDLKISYYPLLILRLGMSLFGAGDFYGSVKVLKDGCELFPDYPDLYFLLGEIHCGTGRYVEGIEYFKKCLEIGEAPIQYVTAMGVGSYQAAYLLGECYLDFGDLDRAVEYYYQSLKMNYYQPALLEKIVTIYSQHYSEEEFKNFFEKKLDFLEDNQLENVLFQIIDSYPNFILELIQNEEFDLKLENKDYLIGKAYWNKREFTKCEQWIKQVEETENLILLKFQLYWYIGDWEQMETILNNLPANFSYPVKDVFSLLKGLERQGDEQSGEGSSNTLSDLLYIMIKDWITIDYKVGIEALLKIFRKIAADEAKLKLGKLFFRAKYYQESIDQFLQVSEDKLDACSFECLAVMSSMGNNNLTAFQFINQAFNQPDHSLGTWLTYLKINLRNVTDYVEKALTYYSDHSNIEQLFTIINREVDKFDRSSTVVGLYDCKR